MSWCIDDCYELKNIAIVNVKGVILDVFYGILVEMRLLIGWIILC